MALVRRSGGSTALPIATVARCRALNLIAALAARLHSYWVAHSMLCTLRIWECTVLAVVDGIAANEDHEAVKEVEAIGCGGMDGGHDGHALLCQSPDNRHHLY